MGLATQSGLLSQISTLALNDLPDDYLETYREKVRALKPEDVMSAARTYFDSANMQVVVVGDRQHIESQAALFGELGIYEPEGIASASRSSTSGAWAPLYDCVRWVCLFLSPRMRLPHKFTRSFPVWACACWRSFCVAGPLAATKWAAAASRESEYGYGVGAAASSWNRLFGRGQNSEDAQIVWRPSGA